MKKQLEISSSPHIHQNHSTQSIMRDVIIALIPALCAGVYFFGIQALITIGLTVGACVAFEWVWQKSTKQKVTITDLSAVVTGILLAFNMPAEVPVYVPVVGAFVAIILAKQFFGGVGQNFINPALAARAFLLAAYPTSMTNFQPGQGMLSRATEDIVTAATVTDAVSGATPLAVMKIQLQNGTFNLEELPSMIDVFLGNISGSIGEISALALLIGGIYLIARGIITWHIPVFYLGTMYVMGLIAGLGVVGSFYSLFLGGAMLGAFFMATDYTTTPMTIKGQIIFAVGGGLIAAIIRFYGGYPEGVSYSILLMNMVVPIIDRYIKNTPFGRKAT